jgi:hypothetical protein
MPLSDVAKSTKWEAVPTDDGPFTQRLKVDGGWIYHISAIFDKKTQTNTVFVPERMSVSGSDLLEKAKDSFEKARSSRKK